MKRLLMIFAAALILVTAAFSQGPYPPPVPDRTGRPGPGRGDIRMKLESLDLSKEQRDRIESTAIETRKKIIPIKAEIELRQVDLRTAMRSDQPDEQRILALSREINDLQYKIKELRIKERLLVHSILTSEQREKLRVPGPGPEPEDE